jgi:hypothetical protein
MRPLAERRAFVRTERSELRPRRIAALILLPVLLVGCKDQTGALTGRVADEYDRAVSGAVIVLDGTDYEATTDSAGRYAIPNIEPGSYTVTGAAPEYDFDIIYDVAVGGGETVTLDLAAHSKDYLEPVRKPNIYLYPPEATEVSVRLSFPKGGGVTVSDPAYGDGWEVEVAPEGVIDGAYTYLFYEADVPVEWQHERGWLIESADLHGFFEGNLRAYGFNDREIRDFLEYWELRLTADYYAVFPQPAADIEPLIGLDVDPEPDSVLRLYYYLVADPPMGGELAPPEIPHFEREGFSVVEWGVVL